MLSSMDFFQRSSSHLIPKSVADRTHGFLPQGTLHATRLIEKQLLLSAYTHVMSRKKGARERAIPFWKGFSVTPSLANRRPPSYPPASPLPPFVCVGGDGAYVFPRPLSRIE